MQPLLSGVLRRRAHALTIACVASSGHQICEALVPLAIGLAVDHAVNGGPPSSILLAVGGIVALFVVLAAGGGANFWQTTSASIVEAHDLRVRAAARLLADTGIGGGRRAGELANVLVSDAKATADITRAVVNVVSGCAGLLVTVVVLLRVDPWLGIGIVVTAPTLTLAINRISPWLERGITARQHTAGQAAALAAELVHALRPLRGFGGVPEAVRRYRRASRTSLNATLDGATASAAADGAGLVATGLVLAGVTASAAAMATSGRIGVGEFVTVIAMASFAGEPVERIAAGIKQAAISRASAARIAAVIDGDMARPAPSSLGRSGPAAVADGPDLGVRAGEMFGVVTTDPAMADRVVDALSRRPGVLAEPHVTHLFGRTLHDALDTGRDAEPATVARALAAARATNVGTSIVDGGANLSGGQRQRVALARALAARPSMLILRDPLTAVDAVTEDAIADGLTAMRRDDDGTTVVLSTSPALLSRCDRVAFLPEDGNGPPIVATHAELAGRADYAGAVLR